MIRSNFVMSWTSQRLAVSGRGVIIASVVWGLGLATTGWGAVDFAHQVVPILRTHCGKCHTGDQLKGGFSMNDRASLMEGGESGSEWAREVDIQREGAEQHRGR